MAGINRGSLHCLKEEQSLGQAVNRKEMVDFCSTDTDNGNEGTGVLLRRCMTRREDAHEHTSAASMILLVPTVAAAV